MITKEYKYIFNIETAAPLFRKILLRTIYTAAQKISTDSAVIYIGAPVPVTLDRITL